MHLPQLMAMGPSIKREGAPLLGQKEIQKQKNAEPTRGHTAARRGIHYPLQKASKGESPDAQGIGAADLATWKAAPIELVRPLGYHA